MSASIYPNQGKVDFSKCDFSWENIDAHKNEFHEMLTLVVIASLSTMYVPFNPEVKEVKDTATGVTYHRDENWQNEMVRRASQKMIKLSAALNLAKTLPKNEIQLYAQWAKDIKQRIKNKEPLLDQVIQDQNVTKLLPIKNVDHVILAYLVRVTKSKKNFS